MKYLSCLLLGALTPSSFAFLVQPRHAGRQTVDLKNIAPLFSSKGDKEDDTERKSFEEAGISLSEQQDQERMDAVGDSDFDNTGSQETDDLEKMRAAIRARASDMGLERKGLDDEYVEAARARALSRRDNARGAGNSDLDLSQISDGNQRQDEWDADKKENKRGVLQKAGDSLTEEEKLAAYPNGALPKTEQFWEEFKLVQWPTFQESLIDLVLVVVILFGMIFLIDFMDTTIRHFFTDIIHILPRDDEIPTSLEGLDLPAGFMNGMSEDDLASFNGLGSSADVSTMSQSVDAILDNLPVAVGNPDL